MFNKLNIKSWFPEPLKYQTIERGELSRDFANIAGDMNRVCAPLRKHTQIAYRQARVEGEIKDGSSVKNKRKRRGKFGT